MLNLAIRGLATPLGASTPQRHFYAVATLATNRTTGINPINVFSIVQVVNPINVGRVLRVVKLLTTSDAAKRLGISRGRIHQYISDGRLPAVKFGSVYSISESDLAKIPKVRKPGPKGKK
jgi:excisionase family DNA binding protein